VLESKPEIAEIALFLRNHGEFMGARTAGESSRREGSAPAINLSRSQLDSATCNFEKIISDTAPLT
jgi:hypothetical protein